MKDVTERDTLIFGQPINWKSNSGGIARFSGIHLPTLKKLIDLGYADPQETQNDSPTIQEFLEFMSVYPNVTVHGYVVSPYREDCRVSVEGIECPLGIMNIEDHYDKVQMHDMLYLCRYADELTFDNSFYAWWD